MWKVRPEYAGKAIQTRVLGNLVNLGGMDTSYRTRVTQDNPGKLVEVPGATQEIYEHLMSDKDAGDWSYLLYFDDGNSGENVDEETSKALNSEEE